MSIFFIIDKLGAIHPKLTPSLLSLKCWYVSGSGDFLQYNNSNEGTEPWACA